MAGANVCVSWLSASSRFPRVERLPRETATKLARALLTIADQDKPPRRFIAGTDAIEAAEAKANELLAQAQASRALGSNLSYDVA